MNVNAGDVNAVDGSAERTAADALIARVLGISARDVDEELEFQSIPQWDSLNHLNLITALETACDVEIDGETIVELGTVEAIRAFVRRHGLRQKPSTERT